MKKLLLSFAFLAIGFAVFAQVKRTNEDLIKLADKHLSSPIKKRVYGNGDVFLQRDMNDFLSNTDRDRKAAIEKQNQSAKTQGVIIEYEHGDDGHGHENLAEILNRPHPSVATTEKYIDDAAAEFRVPAIILKAAAQVQSNWAQTGPSFYGSYGMMGLIETDRVKQITLAAGITKSSVDEIKNEAKANIRAAAALLAYYQKGKPKSDNLADWFEATRELTGLSDEEMKTSLATSFYNVIKNGSKTVSLWREIIEIDANPITIPEYKNAPEKANRSVQGVPSTTTDYPTAVNRLATCNYATGRNGYNIDYYFVHYIAVGTYAGSIAWFRDCTRTTGLSSANYIIRNSDGEISQVVRESDRAYAQGVTQYNGGGISTEHEVLTTNLAMWDSEPMLVAAANLAIDVCNRNNIPRVRRGVNGDRGIYGHSDVRATLCPNLTDARWANLLGRIAGGVVIPSVSLPTLHYVTGTAGSDVVNVKWQANTESTLKGYRLYYALDDDLSGWALAADESTLTAATTSISLSPNQFLVAPTTPAVHFKLTAVVPNGVNPDVESAPSDVYSRTANVTTGPRVLIVDAFDRINDYKSRSHNFAAVYFNTLKDNATMRINSAADEMIDAGTILLSDYDIVLWFTGDDSSADKVFNGTNKAKVKTFLDNGGKLLITGSEIAYNLGRTATPAVAEYDISFMNNYLKASYVSDGAVAIDNPVTGITGTPFEGVTLNLGETYVARFPDNINSAGGGTRILSYNNSTRYAGVAYKGTFGSGTTPGAIIYLGFTLETAPQEQITAFMRKALAYFEVTLPVTLLDYNATLQNTGVVKLQWQTASETDNKEFIISRSADGQQFNVVGKVASFGNTTTGNNYVFNDKKPVNGINYYRLEQQDFDGKTTDLGVRVVNVSLTDNKVEIYPNPTQDIVNVAFAPGVYNQIQLIDISGKILKQISLDSSTTQTTISLSNVASGTYLLKFNGNKPLVKRIIKN